MAALREILAQFGLEFPHGEVEKADQGVEGLVDRFKKAPGLIAGAGAIVGAALGGVAVEVAKFAAEAVAHVASLQFVRELADQADNLRDQATALGLSVEELQAWQHAADLNGVSADELTGSLTKFNRAVDEAAKGTGPAAEAFKALGVNVKDSSGQLGQPIDLLDGIAAGLQNIQDPAKRTALVMDLFGRSGARLLPLFNEGPEGLAKLRAEVEELGGGFSNEFADASDELNDNFARLSLVMRSAKVEIAALLIGPLTDFVELSIKGAKAALAWGRGVKEFVGHTKLLDSALLVLAGGGVALASKKIGGLGAAVDLLGKFLSGKGKDGLKTFGGFLLKTVAPMLVLEDLMVFLAGGDSEIGALLDAIGGEGTQEKVRAWTSEVKESVKAFKVDTLREFFGYLERDLNRSGGTFGEWGAAIARVGALTVDMLTGGWQNFWNKLAALLDAGMFSFKVVWEDIKTLGLSAGAALSDGFDAVWNRIIDGAEAMVTALADVLAKVPGGGDLAEGLRSTVSTLEGSKRSGDALETVEKDARRRQRARLAEGEDILARLQAPAPGASPAAAQAAAGPTVQLEEIKIQARAPRQAPTQNFDFKVTNNVTVPEGTDSEQADAVAKSAADGTKRAAQDLRATHAALVHTAD